MPLSFLKTNRNNGVTPEFEVCNKFFKELYYVNQLWFDVRVSMDNQEGIMELVHKTKPLIQELHVLLSKRYAQIHSPTKD
jgi:hypothetical protein